MEGGVRLPKGGRLMPINRLRSALRKPISEALAALRGKPFSVDDSRDAIKTVFRNINLNDYRDDIAWRVEEAERRQRNSSFGKAISHALASDDMFTEELAREVWIPLGENQQVSLIDATYLHMQHKREEQRIDVVEKQRAMGNTDAFVEMLGEAYANTPTMTVGEVMRQMGRWREAPEADQKQHQ
jgi:hypothetical protein